MGSLATLELLSLLALVLVSALLTGAEAAYFSLGRARLKRLAEQHDPEQGPLQPLLSKPHDLLVTLLVGITLANIGASAIATAMAATLFGPLGLAISIGVMTVLILVFGEVLPMTLAVEHPGTLLGVGEPARGVAVRPPLARARHSERAHRHDLASRGLGAASGASRRSPRRSCVPSSTWARARAWWTAPSAR